jgi:conjugative transfer signal peptidase TraF
LIAAAAGAATLTTACLATLIWPPRPLLVWNASASSAIGLYRISASRHVRAGDMIAAWPPPGSRELAARRGYLALNVPLVKRAAAVEGDDVCAAGEAVFINGVLAATRKDRDPSGRPLPSWMGCFKLGKAEFLLLSNDAPNAFDGRYFGITRAAEVIGEARLVWPG